MKHLILETPQDEQNLLAIFNGIKNSTSIESLPVLAPILVRLKGQIKEIPVAENAVTGKGEEIQEVKEA